MFKNIKKIISLTIVFLILFLLLISNNTVKYAESNNMSVNYCSHIQNVGWESDFSKANGEISGTSGRSLRLEGMKIKLNNAPSGAKIKYKTHVQYIGWQDWRENGDLSGTTGQSLRLEAIQIKLEGISDYKIQYRVHVQNIGWQGWREDGEIAGTTGQGLRLEAIQIKLVQKESGVEYCSHIQNMGWENDFSKTNGETSGTTGKALRVEALKIRLSGNDSKASIQYQTHVQNIGWQEWRENGQVAGTSGQSLKIEAIRIKLNNLSNKSVQYRVHIEGIGWQEWKTDGAMAGTTGRGLRIEAIQIRLVDKINNPSKKGIDVSTFQDDIDWKKVKDDGVEFAMIRAGFRGYGLSSDGTDGKLVTDSCFHANMTGAIANGINVGVYFFTQAKNEQEAIEEANYTINLIKNYKVTYPVAIDTEMSSHPQGRGRADLLSVQQRTNVVKAFCETIKKAGYEPMIYASKWWFVGQLDVSQLKGYSLWLAHYTGATQDDPFAEQSGYKGDYIMWQYTSQGTVNGILGDVDMNVTMPGKTIGESLNILYNNVNSVGSGTEEDNSINSSTDDDTLIKIFY